MAKFVTIYLAPLCDLTPDAMARGATPTPAWHPQLAAMLGDLPAGSRAFWGIPFDLAPSGGPRWVELLGDRAVSVPLNGRAGYVVFAHFCNASIDSEAKRQPPDVTLGRVTRPGEHLADYVLVYQDGSEHRQPIRRRFEINEPGADWGQLAFAARPHTSDMPWDWGVPSAESEWGHSQVGLVSGDYQAPNRYWIYALGNPHPERDLAAVLLEPTGADRAAVAGITLYLGRAHPLQHRRLQAFRIVLPESEASLPDKLDAAIDLGIIARKYAVPAFSPEPWLEDELQGWGEQTGKPQPQSDLRLDITASLEATLTVGGHPVELEPAYETGSSASDDGAARVEVLSPLRTWVHATITDPSGRPTPARVHFRSPDGRYLPPYGHRREVNDGWFQDYGADLKLGSTDYAYVDGRFQIELPVGDVYVEAVKGFEFEPLRQRLRIEPGQRELRLTLTRSHDWRRRGWVTADTHVHFLSPQTAVLEAQAEGVNLVNLLASQWGELYTNVGDLTGDLSGVSTPDTLVWVGTENRQHILGHMSLLGVRGQPVFPMTTGGPSESTIGDTVAASLAEWADRCREREGVVVIPHFPDPYLEVAADIILGKVDGVEIRYFSPNLDNYFMGEWYRFLNLGYRVAAVGGTDKMSAGMPVGGVRTYAHLGDAPLTFANWARAVRGGRTFTTSGPLIGLSVEGRSPGDEIQLPASGGTLGVQAWADSVHPIHALELVVNGRVVDRAAAPDGQHRIQLDSVVRLQGSAWIAARCVSRLVVWHCWPVNVAAHTSPVYVVAGGQEIFSPSEATFMLTMLDGGLTYLDTLSIPASPEKHNQIKQVFRQAQAEMHRRLHAHGHGHAH